TCPRSITRTASSGKPGRLIAPLLVRSSSQKRAGDHHSMHFARAFADPADSRLAVPALDGELLADAVAAVNLHGAIDHAAEHFARIELCDRRLGAEILAAIGLPRSFPRQPPRRAQLDLRIREHPLYRLPFGEQFAEGAALLGMIDRHPERSHTHPDVARRVRKAQASQQIEA